MIRIHSAKHNTSFKIKNSLFLDLKKKYFNLRFKRTKKFNIKPCFFINIRKQIAVILTAINKSHNV